MASASADQREQFSRIFVKKSILEFLFGVKVGQLLCFQNFFTLRGFADVTFFDLATCLRVVAGWEQNQGHQLLGCLHLQQLCNQGNVLVLVHMYNPFVPGQDVLFAELLQGGEGRGSRAGREGHLDW